MSSRTATDQTEWTGGPAKWAAVGVLALASIAGSAWSVRQRLAAPGAVLPVAAVTTDGVPTVEGADGAVDGVGRINLNTATLAELELLPGIGPATARRILDARTAAGAFRRLEDLGRVKGIGPRTLERLRPLVTVD